MIGISLSLWTAIRIPSALLATPSAVTFTAAAGGEDGEVDIDITALPVSWGDLLVPGDGLGEAGVLEWWNEFDGWATLCDPAATGLYTRSLIPDLWGVATDIKVRGVSDSAAAGAVATDSVTVDGTPFSYELVTSGGVLVTSGGQAVYIRI